MIGRMLGVSRADFAPGARLERLNRHDNAEIDRKAEAEGRPEDAISFYGKARAERRAATLRYEAEGAENAATRADAELQDRAVRMILADPLSHLRASILFLWRGTAFLALPLLIAAGIGFFQRDPVLIGLTAISAGGAAVMALTTHFLPRYYDPLLPATFLFYVFLAACVVLAAVNRLYPVIARRAKLPPLPSPLS